MYLYRLFHRTGRIAQSGNGVCLDAGAGLAARRAPDDSGTSCGNARQERSRCAMLYEKIPHITERVFCDVSFIVISRRKVSVAQGRVVWSSPELTPHERPAQC